MPPVFQDCLCDLVANARKYTPPGGCIHAKLEEDEDTFVLQVSDNGIGIPEDQIDRVVSFGFRGKNVANTIPYGGGFGLTKAYFYTLEMGGRMWIESNLSRGTTITIHIPKK